MKLRYYLRGLGIGIVVTALIMGISNEKSKPLTDAEIKAKAAALGMVESDFLKLSDVMVSAEPTTAPEVTAKPTAEPTAAPEVTSKPTAEPTAVPETESMTAAITVKSGSDSGTVCRQLAEAGLIENAAEFDQYLIENGYSKKICVGTYEIQMGTTEEEIAKIITKTR